MPPKSQNKRKRSDLNWKKVDHKFADALGDGWMGLEEIDGVDVEFNEGHSGERIVKLKVGADAVQLPPLTRIQPTSVENVVDVPFVEDEEPTNANGNEDDEQPAKKKSRSEQKKSEKREAAKKKRASAKQAKREEAEASQANEPKAPPEPQFDGELLL